MEFDGYEYDYMYEERDQEKLISLMAADGWTEREITEYFMGPEPKSEEEDEEKKEGNELSKIRVIKGETREEKKRRKKREKKRKYRARKRAEKEAKMASAEIERVMDPTSNSTMKLEENEDLESKSGPHPTPFPLLPLVPKEPVEEIRELVDHDAADSFTRMIEMFLFLYLTVEEVVEGGWNDLYNLVCGRVDSSSEEEEEYVFAEIVIDSDDEPNQAVLNRENDETILDECCEVVLQGLIDLGSGLKDSGERVRREFVAVNDLIPPLTEDADLKTENECTDDDKRCEIDGGGEMAELKDSENADCVGVMAGQTPNPLPPLSHTRRQKSKTANNRLRSTPSAVRCYGCGEIGHFKKRCPMKNFPCACCGRMGHAKPICWRIKEKCRQCGEVGHLWRMCDEEREKLTGKKTILTRKRRLPRIWCTRMILY